MRITMKMVLTPMALGPLHNLIQVPIKPQKGTTKIALSNVYIFVRSSTVLQCTGPPSGAPPWAPI